MSQWELKGKTTNLPKARENARDQVKQKQSNPVLLSTLNWKFILQNARIWLVLFKEAQLFAKLKDLMFVRKRQINAFASILSRFGPSIFINELI